MHNKTIPGHIRIAALQCDFEGGEENTLKVIDLWTEYEFNFEQLFHTHGEQYNAVYDAGRHQDKLRRYLEKCRCRNLSVFLYLNCHILLQSQEARAPEWALVSENGKYQKFYDTYYGVCLNSSWTDYFLDTIGSLRDFDLKGIFFDGPPRFPCYCERCQKKFLSQYNLPMSEASRKQLDAFVFQTVLAFKRAAYEKVKATNPDWVSYYNEGLFHIGANSDSIREVLNCNDLVGTEGGFQFYGKPKDTGIWRCGSSAKLAEAVAEGKNTVIFMAADHKPWSWYLHTPTETTLCYMSALANGASVWYGLHSATALLDGAAGKTVRELVQFDRQHEDLYLDTTSMADIGLFYSFDTAATYTSGGEETDFYASTGRHAAAGIGNYSESFFGALAILFRSGCHYDLVTEFNLDELSRYKVLIVPTGACLTEATAAKLRAYVAGGGTLIADSEITLYDDDFNPRGNFLLADVFGIDLKGYRRYHNYDYFAFDEQNNPFAGDGIRYLPAPLTALDITPRSGVEVLARLCPPLPGRYSTPPEKPSFPFIIKNRFKQGQAYYLAGTFFEQYFHYALVHYRQYIHRLVAAASSPLVQLVSTRGAVEFTVRRSRSADKVLVHLVNYTGGMTRPIEHSVPIRGLHLQLNGKFSSATALRAGVSLDIKRNNLVPLPELNDFEVVVLSEDE